MFLFHYTRRICKWTLLFLFAIHNSRSDVFICQKELDSSGVKFKSSDLSRIRSNLICSEVCYTKCRPSFSIVCVRVGGRSSNILEQTSHVLLYNADGLANHDSSCTDNSSCNFDGAVCFYGKCLCHMGLYFSPTLSTCLKVCKEFGVGMAFYKGAGITDHNTKLLKNVTSPTECMRKCVLESKFICREVDIGSRGQCQLSDVGYLDVSRRYREREQKHWSMGHRNCK